MQAEKTRRSIPSAWLISSLPIRSPIKTERKRFFDNKQPNGVQAPTEFH